MDGEEDDYMSGNQSGTNAALFPVELAKLPANLFKGRCNVHVIIKDFDLKSIYLMLHHLVGDSI